jgi:hypothetical protein
METPVLTPRPDLTTSDRREFFFLNWLSWAVTLATIAALVVAYKSSPVTVSLDQVPESLAIAGLSLAVFAFYRIYRDSFFVLSATSALSTIASFTFIGPVVCYAAIHLGSSAPLWSAQLAWVDEHILGLDWPFLLKWVADHGIIANLLCVAYASSLFQAICAVFILSATGQVRRLQTVVLTFQLTLISCALVAICLPAMDQFTFRQIEVADGSHWIPQTAVAYVDDFVRLRTERPVVSLDNTQGVITFPSFHAVLALLLSWAFWKTPKVRWVALCLNATMLLATPICGGHYFIDIVAGLLLAIVLLMITSRSILHIRAHIDRRLSSRTNQLGAFDKYKGVAISCRTAASPLR